MLQAHKSAHTHNWNIHNWNIPKTCTQPQKGAGLNSLSKKETSPKFELQNITEIEIRLSLLKHHEMKHIPLLPVSITV